jgi:hypothetical protein
MQDINPANALAAPFAKGQHESRIWILGLPHIPTPTPTDEPPIEGTEAAIGLRETLTLPPVIAACVRGWAGQGVEADWEPLCLPSQGTRLRNADK